jgi:hypothetical protein
VTTDQQQLWYQYVYGMVTLPPEIIEHALEIILDSNPPPAYSHIQGVTNDQNNPVFHPATDRTARP